MQCPWDSSVITGIPKDVFFSYASCLQWSSCLALLFTIYFQCCCCLMYILHLNTGTEVMISSITNIYSTVMAVSFNNVIIYSYFGIRLNVVRLMYVMKVRLIILDFAFQCGFSFYVAFTHSTVVCVFIFSSVPHLESEHSSCWRRIKRFCVNSRNWKHKFIWSLHENSNEWCVIVSACLIHLRIIVSVLGIYFCEAHLPPWPPHPHFPAQTASSFNPCLLLSNPSLWRGTYSSHFSCKEHIICILKASPSQAKLCWVHAEDLNTAKETGSKAQTAEVQLTSLRLNICWGWR